MSCPEDHLGSKKLQSVHFVVLHYKYIRSAAETGEHKPTDTKLALVGASTK